MSQHEELFAQQVKALKIEAVREYRFCPDRRWRSDFAIPELKLLIEIEGGVWQNGRHNRGAGYISDCEKYNKAAEMGFMVYRFVPEMVKSGEAVAQVERVITAIKDKK